MLARLDRRLPLLTGGAKDLPERQRTLRQTLAWSYDLLPAQEQALFCRLAVFAGGFTLEAAEAIVRADPDLADLDALEGVERLTEQSLLRPATGEAGLRFGMLETIREFGLEQLGQCPEREASARRAHAMYFADLITRSRRVVDMGDSSGIAQMIAERDNVRAMLHFLLEAGETETALRVTMRLSDHWTFTGGQAKDGRTRLERALADGTSSTSVARAYALQGLAMIATHQGDHKAAYAAATESLALARAADEASAIMGAIFWLSSACAFANKTPEGYWLMVEGEQIARGMEDSEWLGWALWYLGMTGSSVGRLEESRAGLEEGIALSRRLGDPWCEAASLMALGLLAGYRDDPEQAAIHHAESLTLVPGAGRRHRGALQLARPCRRRHEDRRDEDSGLAPGRLRRPLRAFRLPVATAAGAARARRRSCRAGCARQRTGGATHGPWQSAHHARRHRRGPHVCTRLVRGDGRPTLGLNRWSSPAAPSPSSLQTSRAAPASGTVSRRRCPRPTRATTRSCVRL